MNNNYKKLQLVLILFILQDNNSYHQYIQFKYQMQHVLSPEQKF